MLDCVVPGNLELRRFLLRSVAALALILTLTPTLSSFLKWRERQKFVTHKYFRPGFCLVDC